MSSRTNRIPPGPRPETWRCFAVALAGFALAGCGQSDFPPEPAIEVRGEPIMMVAAPSPATNAAATPAAPAVDASLPADTAQAAAAVTMLPGGFAQVGFEQLAGYAIEVTDELLGPVTNDLAAVSAKTDALIPPAIKALNEARVAVKGFMLPLKVEGGLVTELLIMRDQSMCCYGSTPKLNEWISVKMAAKGVRPLMDQPVTLFGKLHVGEMRENGYLTGIYRMDGDKMEVPED